MLCFQLCLYNYVLLLFGQYFFHMEKEKKYMKMSDKLSNLSEKYSRFYQSLKRQQSIVTSCLQETTVDHD